MTKPLPLRGCGRLSFDPPQTVLEILSGQGAPNPLADSWWSAKVRMSDAQFVGGKAQRES
jgi:hypothetical protein